MNYLRLREEDVKGVSSFVQEAWKEAGPGAPGWSGATQDDVSEISSTPFLRKMATSPDVDFFLAKDGERVVGMAVNRVREGGLVELSGIIVLQSLVGKRIGSGLFALAEEAAISRGASRMTVKTETVNRRALSFYRGKGFVRSGEAVEKVGGRDIPVAVLFKDLRRGEGVSPIRSQA
jgi:ribosomal protein S18 acetylase RimI-like enzyme